MSSALLYIRVSTDEQAVKGYSLRNQEDVLRHHCILNNIAIQDIYTENYSAKTFERPKWLKLISDVKSKRTGRPDLLLFTRWDRFSRNAGDAYHMIRVLQKLGIEPQAIEQQLDLAIPENKITLAFYLSIPEVENDRRGLNVKNGLRKAKEQGRWMGPAPIGYKNICLENGEKRIFPVEPQASIIKQVFEMLAERCFSVKEVYRQAVSLGLKCSPSNFYYLVHNPVYVGQINVFDKKDRSSYLVPGKHAGIVPLKIFNDAQNYLHKKLRKLVTIKRFNPTFPLRRFIRCPKCLKTLTASSSSGRTKIYYYYHCSCKCGFRVRAEKVHEKFVQQLKQMHLLDRYSSLSNDIFEKMLAEQSRKSYINYNRALKSIEQFSNRIYRAKELLLDGQIDPENFKVIHNDLETKINLEGDVISAEYLSQIQLFRNRQRFASMLSSLDIIWFASEDKQKSDLVNCLLERDWIWEESGTVNIFKMPFQIMYGLKNNTPTPQMDENECNEISAALAKLSFIIAKTTL